MNKRNSFPPDILKLSITIPFRERVDVSDLEMYLQSISPHVTVDIGSRSVLSYLLSHLSIGADTTRSKASNRCRAHKHLADQASEASLESIVEELDQSYESEPDGETLATENSTRSSVSDKDDLSFISHSEEFCEIEDVEEWITRNGAQDLR